MIITIVLKPDSDMDLRQGSSLRSRRLTWVDTNFFSKNDKNNIILTKFIFSKKKINGVFTLVLTEFLIRSDRRNLSSIFFLSWTDQSTRPANSQVDPPSRSRFYNLVIILLLISTFNIENI
jgi:hypothetical protein